MKRIGMLGVLCAAALMMQGCATSAQGAPVPTTTPTGAQLQAEDVAWPSDKLKTNENGVPTFSVYVVDDKKVENVDVESYVAVSYTHLDVYKRQIVPCLTSLV